MTWIDLIGWIGLIGVPMFGAFLIGAMWASMPRRRR
jgi:hypothetical protein